MHRLLMVTINYLPLPRLSFQHGPTLESLCVGGTNKELVLGEQFGVNGTSKINQTHSFALCTLKTVKRPTKQKHTLSIYKVRYKNLLRTKDPCV